MEYCGETTLKELIQNEKYKENYDENKVWFLFREILQGLNYIHENGIIHRDMKPANVLIDANDHVKIVDFGFATTRVPSNHRLETHMTYSDAQSAANSQTDGGVVIESKLPSLGGVQSSRMVGTPIYMAPEIECEKRLIYTEV